MSEIEQGFYAITSFSTPEGLPLVLQDPSNLPTTIVAKSDAEIPATFKAEKVDNGNYKLTVNGNAVTYKDGKLKADKESSTDWLISVRNDTSDSRDPIATVQVANDSSIGWAVNGDSEEEPVLVRELESHPGDYPVTELFKFTPIYME